MKSICTINILGANRKLLNNNDYPIIFYSDGESPVASDVLQDSDFIKILKNNALHVSIYNKASVCLATYFFEETLSDDKIKLETLKVSDIIPIDDSVIDKFIKDVLNQFSSVKFSSDNDSVTIKKQVAELQKSKHISKESLKTFISNQLDIYGFTEESKKAILERFTTVY